MSDSVPDSAPDSVPGTVPAAGQPRTGGRVVAELGRPETPEETAERKADNSRKHRQNQTTRNLLLALLASLAVVLVTVLFVVRPDQTPPKTVNWHSNAADARVGQSHVIADPKLPAGWTSNSAVLKNAGEKNQSWYIGFITPKNQFIGMEQSLGAEQGFAASLLGKARPTGSTTIGGRTWTVYNQRGSGDVGNFQYSLVTAFAAARSTVVLHGSASTAEFATLARAVATALVGKG